MRGWYLPSLVQRTLCLLSDVLDDAFAPHFPRILPGIVHRAALDVGIHVPLPTHPALVIYASVVVGRYTCLLMKGWVLAG